METAEEDTPQEVPDLSFRSLNYLNLINKSSEIKDSKILSTSAK